MKSLLILRHAEAEPGGGVTADHERVLTPGGRAQAHALGIWLASQRIAPAVLLSSSATRARQTAELVARGAGWRQPIQALDSLYNASAPGLLEVARAQSNAEVQVLLVAHAPGVAEFVGLAAARQGDVALAFDPATLAEIVFECGEWADVSANQGRLRLLLPG